MNFFPIFSSGEQGSGRQRIHNMSESNPQNNSLLRAIQVSSSLLLQYQLSIDQYRFNSRILP